MTNKNTKKLKVIDLFAGIGGMRLGFEKAGFKIVYSNDNNPEACKTYRENFNDIDDRDITEVKCNDLPDFDVLSAGFPCQPFSMIGKRYGLDDPRGHLFYEIVRIIKEKSPKAFLLENVKHLRTHDKGATYSLMKNELQNAGNGYIISEAILNSKYFGVPQHRERMYIVGLKKPFPEFIFPKYNKSKTSTVGKILEKKVHEKYYLSEKYYKGLMRHKKRHSVKGSGFGCAILDLDEPSNTLVSGNMGRERNLIQDIPVEKNRWGIRKLTERECARLQGFPDDFVIPVSMTQAYKQFGNAVSIPVIYKIASHLKEILEKNK